jgi:Radical SAM superfamily
VEVIAVGVSAHILSEMEKTPSIRAKRCWPWLTLLTRSPKSSSHAVTNHLSGGEPAARRDIVEITAAAHRANLYTNLITSAVGLSEKRLAALAEGGLDHVQISIQDSDAASADRIGGYDGAYARKPAASFMLSALCQKQTSFKIDGHIFEG